MLDMMDVVASDCVERRVSCPATGRLLPAGVAYAASALTQTEQASDQVWPELMRLMLSI
jgi:hypothetical protein